MDVQGLGVELIRDVRCLTCGKVLDGKIGNEYDRTIIMLLNEINDSMPPQLSRQEKDQISKKFMANHIKELHAKLGIRRQCCMTNLAFKSQHLTGAPSPPGNIIIDRQNVADKEKGYKRSITRIDLSLPSKVPGKGGSSMISLAGEEEYSPEWKDYYERIKKDFTSPATKYEKIPTRIISSSKSILPMGFNIQSAGIPMISMGDSTPIDPQYLDMLDDPQYITGEFDTNIELETFTNLSHMSITDNNQIDDTNFRDIMDYEITAPGMVDDLNNPYF